MGSLLHSLLPYLRAVSAVEAVAVVTGFVSVWLTMRNHIGTWFWGILNVIAYGILFLQQQNYGNAGLNLIYFLPIQFYGWFVWLRFGPKRKDDLPVTAMTAQNRFAALLITVGLSALATFLLKRFTPDPYPLADGVTTALSIMAQYLEVFKRIENWILWIVADIIYVFYLFPIQKDYLSTGLYIAFTIMSAIGLRNWLRLLRDSAAKAPLVA